MSRIEPRKSENTDAETAAKLDAVKAKLGMVPNLFTVLAHSPVALDSYLQLSDNVATGGLTAPQREMVALISAQKNGCEYCLSAHTAIGKMVGMNEQEILQARQGHASNSQDAAILTFADELLQTRGEASEAAFNAARDAGLDDQVMVEIVANIALNVITNYVNRLAGTEVDFPHIKLELAA